MVEKNLSASNTSCYTNTSLLEISKRIILSKVEHWITQQKNIIQKVMRTHYWLEAGTHYHMQIIAANCATHANIGSN